MDIPVPDAYLHDFTSKHPSITRKTRSSFFFQFEASPTWPSSFSLGGASVSYLADWFLQLSSSHVLISCGSKKLIKLKDTKELQMLQRPLIGALHKQRDSASSVSRQVATASRLESLSVTLLAPLVLFDTSCLQLHLEIRSSKVHRSFTQWKLLKLQLVRQMELPFQSKQKCLTEAILEHQMPLSCSYSRNCFAKQIELPISVASS
jgi:hypothetical protein